MLEAVFCAAICTDNVGDIPKSIEFNTAEPRRGAPMKKLVFAILLIASPAWAQEKLVPKLAPKPVPKNVATRADPCAPIGENRGPSTGLFPEVRSFAGSSGTPAAGRAAPPSPPEPESAGAAQRHLRHVVLGGGIVEQSDTISGALTVAAGAGTFGGKCLVLRTRRTLTHSRSKIYLVLWTVMVGAQGIEPWTSPV